MGEGGGKEGRGDNMENMFFFVNSGSSCSFHKNASWRKSIPECSSSSLEQFALQRYVLHLAVRFPSSS
jgi:hypothetical protein